MTRGDIYRVRLPRQRGHVQHGDRYAVVVQADELLGLSTAVVTPTSRTAAAATFRPEIEVHGEPTRVLVEQLRTVDVDRLGDHAGRVNHAGLKAIDDALLLVLGL